MEEKSLCSEFVVSDGLLSAVVEAMAVEAVIAAAKSVTWSLFMVYPYFSLIFFNPLCLNFGISFFFSPYFIM